MVVVDALSVVEVEVVVVVDVLSVVDVDVVEVEVVDVVDLRIVHAIGDDEVVNTTVITGDEVVNIDDGVVSIFADACKIAHASTFVGQKGSPNYHHYVNENFHLAYFSSVDIFRYI